MADPNRNPTHPLIDALERTGHRFSFFQAVSLLERALDAPMSVGEQGPPSGEVLRFTADPMMRFAPSDITRIRRKSPAGDDDTERFEIEAAFLGLYGPSSPLPPMVNEAIASNAIDSGALRRFLDVFNNRAIGLLYRIWRRYRHDQVYDTHGRDEISRLIASAAGVLDLIEENSDAGMDAPSKRSALANAASLALFCHSASVLERVIESSMPDVAARVEEWVPRRAAIVAEQRWALGSANSTLGEDAVSGEYVPDISGKFRVWLGPMDLDEYLHLLPGAQGRETLDQLIRRVLRDHLIYDVVLVIRPGSAPAWMLGQEGGLGRTAWLGRPGQQDAQVAFVGAR